MKNVNKDEKHARTTDSAILSPSKGPVSPIAEGKENGATDKPIRRTVSFTNSVSVLGEENESPGKQSQPSHQKMKRTRSSERFNAKERRRSSAISIRYPVTT